jgi:hypothetical protein
VLFGALNYLPDYVTDSLHLDDSGKRVRAAQRIIGGNYLVLQRIETRVLEFAFPAYRPNGSFDDAKSDRCS